MLFAILASLVLLPAAAYLALYFWVNSSAGQESIRRALAERLPLGALSFQTLGFGPTLGEVRLSEAVVRDRSGREAITAGSLTARVGWGAAFGAPLRIDDVRAVGYGVHLAWDEAGQFSLKGAFKKGPLPPEVKRPPGTPPPRPKSALFIEGIRLERGVVTLGWPAWGLRFEAVDAAGAVRITPEAGLEIVADLTGGRSLADLAKAGKQVGYEAIAIDGFRWLDQGFATKGLTLTGPDGAKVALAGKMGFAGEKPTLEATGDVAVAAAQAEALAPGWAPEGGRLTGLEAKLADGRLEGAVANLDVPELAGGPVGARGLNGPVSVRVEPGALGVAGQVTTRGLRAERLTGPEGVEARGVRLGLLEATVGAGVEAKIEELSAAGLVLPDGEVGATTIAAQVSVGLGGGKLTARVLTDQGTVNATGAIDVGLLSRKVEATIELAMTELTKTMAKTLLTSVPDDVRARLRTPVGGSARVAGTAQQSKDESQGGRKRWGMGFELVQAELTGGEKLVFAEGRWKTDGDEGPATP